MGHDLERNIGRGYFAVSRRYFPFEAAAFSALPSSCNECWVKSVRNVSTGIERNWGNREKENKVNVGVLVLLAI